ncbi:MAG: serine acetyltransferase [Oscillospiraceae bacterium]|nr:serine acetyltransferase [Oscillospiraceae bacterium]
MYDQHIQSVASQLATNIAAAQTQVYGKRLRLPDRQTIISLLGDLRKLFFPAYFGDSALMSLSPEDYAALLLEPIEAQLGAQIALALPEDSGGDPVALAQDFVKQLPRVHQLLMSDVDALFEGDPAAQNKQEIIFSYPGLFAIFVYRVAHELYLRKIPTIPRIMSEYAHSRTGIDIHPGAAIGSYFFIDHGTGVVVGETSVIGDHVKLYQGVTLGALSPRGGHTSLPGKRHPTVESGVTIYSGATILGGDTVIGENAVIGGNAFLTRSVPAGTRVVLHAPELTFK